MYKFYLLKIIKKLKLITISLNILLLIKNQLLYIKQFYGIN